MFSPVGSQPPSVYWRRRLLVLGSVVLLVLLLVLTINVVSGGDDDSTAGGSGGPSGSTTAPTTRSEASSSTPATAAGRSSSTVAPPASPSTSAPARTVTPTRCATAALAVQAVAGQSAYKLGAQPMLALQVTNIGAAPCVQDLADKQIVLKVYNGESRVWGSHDCEVQPGTTNRTLPMNQPVRISITWSGRTSQEGCKGARQRVGAGTYTLYATLGGKSGKAAQFTIS